MNARLGLLISAFVIIAVAVPWNSFEHHAYWERVGRIPFSRPVRVADVLRNITLFVPFGFFTVRYRIRSRALLSALMLAAALSLSVELSQVYSPKRFPSTTDVICNLIGTVVGAQLARWESGLDRGRAAVRYLQDGSARLRVGFCWRRRKNPRPAGHRR